MESRDYRFGGALLAAAALHILPVMPSTTVGRKVREEITQTLHLNPSSVPPDHTHTLAKTRDELKIQLTSALHPTTIEVPEREKVAEINAFRESIRLNDGEFSEHVFRLYLYSQPVTPERRAKVNRAKEKYHLLRSELTIMLNQGIAVQHALPQVMAKMKYESTFEDLAEMLEFERGNCTVASIVSMMLLADTGFTAHLYLRYEAANPYTDVGHTAPLLKYDNGYQWDIMTGGRSSGVGVVVPVSYLPDLYAIQHDLPTQRRRYPLVKAPGESLFGAVSVPSHMYERGGNTYFRTTLIPPYNPQPNTPAFYPPYLSNDASSAIFDARFLRPFTPSPVRAGITLPTNNSQEGLILFETPPLPNSPISTIPLRPLPIRVPGFTPSADLAELDRLASVQVTMFSQERDPNRRLLFLSRIVGLYRQMEDNIRTQGYQDQDHLHMATYAHTRAERYHKEGSQLLEACRTTTCLPSDVVFYSIEDLAYLGDDGVEFLLHLETQYLNTHPDFFQLDPGTALNGMSIHDWVNIVLLLIFNPAIRDSQLAMISQLPMASQVALCRHIRANSLVSEREKAQAFARLLSAREDTFAKILRVEASLADYYYFYGLFDSAHYPPNEDYNTIRGIVSERVRQNNLPDTVVEPFMTSLVEDRVNFGITISHASVPPCSRRRPIVNTIQAWSMADTTNGENSLYSRRVLSEATLLLSQHQEMLQAWYDYQFPGAPASQLVNGHVGVDLRSQAIPGYLAWAAACQAQSLNFGRNYFPSH